MKLVRRFLPMVGTALVLVVADQLSKNWAESELKPTGKVVDFVLGISFRYAQNQGMAFSRFPNAGPIIGLIAVGIVAGLFWFSRQITSTPARVIIGVVMGGAVGNLVDRLVRVPPYGKPTGFMHGAVVDFIYTSWWPTFNIADASIVVGGILLAIIVWRTPEPDPGLDPESGSETDTAPESATHSEPESEPAPTE